MAAMGPAASGADDPSMAEILASIRRILADDEPKASPSLHGALKGGHPGLDAHREVTPDMAANEEDVIVLDRSMLVAPPPARAEGAAADMATEVACHPEPHGDPVAEPGSEAAHDATLRMSSEEVEAHAAGVDLPVAPDPAPDAGATPDLNPLPGTDHVSSTAALTNDAPVPAAAANGWRQPPPALVEADTVSAAASSIATLARSVAAERTAAIQRNGLSIEDVVREEVRPLLKAWLDTHLPGLVERLVQAEIERVVNRATF